MNQDEIDGIHKTFAVETFTNTPDGRPRLAACLIHVHGIADESAVVTLISNNNISGYLDQCAQMGAKVADVATALAAQLDRHASIEDDIGPAEVSNVESHMSKIECDKLGDDDGPHSLSNAITAGAAAIARSIAETPPDGAGGPRTLADVMIEFDRSAYFNNERFASVIGTAIDRHADMASKDTSLIADATLDHAKSIHKLADVIDKVFSRPVRVEKIV